jgi:hypothetical protein
VLSSQLSTNPNRILQDYRNPRRTAKMKTLATLLLLTATAEAHCAHPSRIPWVSTTANPSN